MIVVSGEALMGDDSYGINRAVIERIVAEIAEVVELGVQVAIVIGGGNIFRGVAPAAAGMDRATADYMGMLATVMNAMALQDAMKRQGLECRVQSALNLEQVAEPFIRRRALRHLEKGRVVILAAGTGNPYFSTDTAAVLRAIQIKANLIIKATSVEGVYSADPKKDAAAKLEFERAGRQARGAGPGRGQAAGHLRGGRGPAHRGAACYIARPLLPSTRDTRASASASPATHF